MTRFTFGGKCGVVIIPLWEGAMVSANDLPFPNRSASAIPPKPMPKRLRKWRRLRPREGRGPVQRGRAPGAGFVALASLFPMACRLEIGGTAERRFALLSCGWFMVLSFSYKFLEIHQCADQHCSRRDFRNRQRVVALAVTSF